jgi:dTDP-D-glucose 4,6-dehydratase
MPKFEIVYSLLDELSARAKVKSNSYQITFMTDQFGHERSHSVDESKLELEIGCKLAKTFGTDIRKSVEWHPKN